MKPIKTMWREVNKETANTAYENGKTVRIGNSETDFWSVDKAYHDGKSLEYVAERYLNYYDGPVKYFMHF